MSKLAHFVLGTSRLSREKGSLTLNGIVWDEKSPSALINSKVVGVGDEIDGHRVVEIEKEKVIVIKDNETYDLNLQQRGAE